MSDLDATTGDPTGTHPAWRLEEPWPATLVGLLDVPEPPAADEALAAIAARIGAEVTVLELHPSPDEKRPWSLVVRVPGLEMPVLLACERAKRMDEVRPDLAAVVREARWAVVAETLLDPAGPAEAWTALAAVVAGVDGLRAVMDATTGRWFSPSELTEDLLDEALGPAPDVLWRVQVVSASEDLEQGTAWVFTRGLLRCGLPELELLELPGDRVRLGVELLDRLAELLVQDGTPPPEIPFALGPDVSVALVPWREVAETLDAESLGSEADRAALSQETPNPLRARRAAVCDLEPKGRFRPVWTWPQDAIAALAESSVAIRRSERASERTALLARRRWPEAVACRDRRPEEVVLLVGAVVDRDDDGTIEHGWIQADRVDAGGGSGRLLRATRRGTPMGTVREFTLEDIDAWRLVRGDRVVGPEIVGSVESAILP